MWCDGCKQQYLISARPVHYDWHRSTADTIAGLGDLLLRRPHNIICSQSLLLAFQTFASEMKLNNLLPLPRSSSTLPALSSSRPTPQSRGHLQMQAAHAVNSRRV